MIEIQRDGKGQPFIQWKQAPGGWKRAWIQTKDGDGDWAGTRRYLNVVRTVSAKGGPSGNATDFPIFSDLPEEQILEAFVAAVAGSKSTSAVQDARAILNCCTIPLAKSFALEP